jgi:hypothetical protein
LTASISLLRAEDRLGQQRYLCGSVLTEADIRLFTTLVRFDAVYVLLGGEARLVDAVIDPVIDAFVDGIDLAAKGLRVEVRPARAEGAVPRNSTRSKTGSASSATSADRCSPRPISACSPRWCGSMRSPAW